MIHVDNLKCSYSGEPLFDEVSFSINSNERCGLVGRNGSGKTTLFRLLVQEIVPDGGRISFSKGYRLGYLNQHIRFSRSEVLQEACLGLPPEESDLSYKAEKILFGLGFNEEQMEADPHKLSGGYHLRLHLAKVLLSQPDCLLLDEPTNYLDILSIRFLQQYLSRWKGALILISHDREFMDSISTHTLGIHRKKVRKVKGDTIHFFTQILEEEKIHEKTCINLEKKREHLTSFVERFGAKASKAAQARSRKKMLDKIPALEELKDLYNLHFRFHEKPFAGKKLCELKEICFGYDPQKIIIPNLSFSIEKGERIAIIGKNGYGKSTLLKLIASENRPLSGEVISSDQMEIGYFGQTHIQKLNPQSSIEEEIGAANSTLNFSQVKRLCGVMMFSQDASKKKIGVLSGGEKSRVLLGQILAKPCNLLLLDEPTHHLDMESIEALIEALEEFEGAVVIVTHSELILKRLTIDKLIVCHLGNQEVFEGDYEDFLEKKGWTEEKSKSDSDSGEGKKRHQERVAAQAEIRQLENKIKQVEKKIASSEKSQEDLQKKMQEAVEKGDLATVHELSDRIGLGQKQLDRLLEEFIELSNSLDFKLKS